MRLLHTADWHLGDRLGSRGIDRSADLWRAVERIAGYLAEEKVDVLLIAGDLFSDKCQRQDDLSGTIENLNRYLGPFMRGGGTVLAVTGNHDKEIPCQTLKNSLELADPRELKRGELVPGGRFYLANRPTYYRVKDRAGQEVQFVLLPYPMPACYLDEGETIKVTREEKYSFLRGRLADTLKKAVNSAAFRKDLRSVLMAHVHVSGAALHRLFQMTMNQDVIFNVGDLQDGAFDYIALGHIHRAQELGAPHIRYSGNIERLDLGERDDGPKGFVVFDIGPNGLEGPPRVLPLDPTPIHDIVIDNPNAEIPHLRAQYPDAGRALVQYRLTYKPGDDLSAFLRDLDAIFPRWYEREVVEHGGDTQPTLHQSLPAEELTTEQTARHFVEKELERQNIAPEEQKEILALLDEALAAVR